MQKFQQSPKGKNTSKVAWIEHCEPTP